MKYSAVILVPGFWLGAWAWDEVVASLRAAGHDVTALTLPGLESREADRAGITLNDHVDAIVSAALAKEGRVVLVVHSGASVPGYGACDRIPDRIAAMVYVDTAPSAGPINGQFDGVEFPLTWDALDAQEVAGVTDQERNLLETRGVPEPGAALRDALVLTDDRRRHVPATVICTAAPSVEVREAIDSGPTWIQELGNLTDVTYVDLPTHHWPMLSRPKDLAAIIDRVARGVREP